MIYLSKREARDLESPKLTIVSLNQANNQPSSFSTQTKNALLYSALRYQFLKKSS